MTAPLKHQQQTIIMIERTLRNLEHLNAVADQEGLYEVTQLTNSFASVAGQPWDRLLDRQILKDILLDDARFMSCKFPEIDLRETSIDEPVAHLTENFESVEQYLAFIRNAMAHGNFRLLNRRAFRDLSGVRRLPSVNSSDIAGLLIWNIPRRGKPRTREAVLSIHDMMHFLYAMQRFCKIQEFWLTDVLTNYEAHQQSIVLGDDPWNENVAS